MATRKQKQSNGISAAELMAQLTQDPKFWRAAEKREAERQENAARWHEAEQPIVDDLCRVPRWPKRCHCLGPGEHLEAIPDGAPVLIEHLEGVGYPARIMEGLARAIVVKPAAAYWSRLRASYFSSATLGWTRTRSCRGSNTDSAS